MNYVVYILFSINTENCKGYEPKILIILYNFHNRMGKSKIYNSLKTNLIYEKECKIDLVMLCVTLFVSDFFKKENINS